MGANGSFKDFLKKNSKTLVVPVILIVIGLFMIFHPIGWVKLIVKIVGILFVAAGVLLGCSTISKIGSPTMMLAIILVLLGIICLALSDRVADFILIVIGISMIVNAVISIHDAYIVKGKSDHFIEYIINDIVSLVIGIVLIFVPQGLEGAIAITIGVVLCVIGVSNVITVFRVFRDGGRYIDDGSDVVWEE
ncbi:MAG: DUF308 domain-containing protein [Eubacterium sp.]|nr:DUF308 domain-containing protein [Eubacterium sp.]